MASISGLSISTLKSLVPSSSQSCSLNPLRVQFPQVKFQKQSTFSSFSSATKLSFLMPTKLRAALAEEEIALSPPETASTDQAVSVSVSVSPSDLLTMIFQAEGTMPDSAVPAVTKALEEVEGIAGLKVQVLEGIASVELTKQTTIQATGVASNLVEKIQGSGFKLQTLNLSFQDEEDLS